ncbi:hypothetical protein MLD38_024464 [Melastoma candidum]|uniref:Uncharacterized protein n=1 Tax=Melastoma candidum TaxID=119954 RepID=A0ACB9NTC6_9MYRT|nr:hypothetical protein MLD38_024464 [Melastoma candidum]
MLVAFGGVPLQQLQKSAQLVGASGLWSRLWRKALHKVKSTPWQYFCSCAEAARRSTEVILREGVMPGLLQLTVDGGQRAKELAQHLLMMLRNSPGNWPGNKNLGHKYMERIMEEINADEDANGIKVETTLRMVEEKIAILKHE